MRPNPFVVPVLVIAVAAVIGGPATDPSLRDRITALMTSGTVPGHAAEHALESATTSGEVTMDARAAMERLKRLEGSWSSREKGREGNQGTATYRLTGGGNVLVEDMGGMMTTYHLDGDHLMVTHYCGAGNQPRMRAKVLEEGRFAFEMFDITNLRSPTAYHTTRLDIAFLGNDRVDLTYSGISDGEASSQVFQLTRRGR